MGMGTAAALRGADGAFVSSGHLKEGLRLLLEEAPNGLSEPLLLGLVTIDDSPYTPLTKQLVATTREKDSAALRKVRAACKRIGAKWDREESRWVL